MYAEIGPHVKYFGPNQLAEKILFWLDKDHSLVESFGDWLAHGRKGNTHITLLYRVLMWWEARNKQYCDVRIDDYDTYSLDETLSKVILPALKAFKATERMGYKPVPVEDVPDHLATHGNVDYLELQVDDIEKELIWRWEYIIDEMIWYHEQVLDGFMLDEQSSEEYKAYTSRVERAAILWGKYYSGLWW